MEYGSKNYAFMRSTVLYSPGKQSGEGELRRDLRAKTNPIEGKVQAQVNIDVGCLLMSQIGFAPVCRSGYARVAFRPSIVEDLVGGYIVNKRRVDSRSGV